MRYLLYILTLGLALSWSVPLAARTESRKELAARLDDTQARLKVLEDRMLTGDPAAVRLQQRLDDLEAQMRRQVGDNERLGFENKRLREDLDTVQSALKLVGADAQTAKAQAMQANAALGRYITGGEPAHEESQAAAAAKNAAFDSQQAQIQSQYNEAKGYLERGFFDQALAAFEAFTSAYPTDALSGPAFYWMGEIMAVQGKPREAANQYIATLKQFPKGSKAPEAMVRLGATLYTMGDAAEACRTLRAVSKTYPKASASVKAKARLERRRANCR